MKCCPAILSLVLGVCAAMPEVSFAQVTLPRPRDGRLTETTTAKRALVTVVATDKDGKVIPTERFPRTFEFGTGLTPPEPSIRIPIPAVVNRSDNGEPENVIDVTQTTKILEESGHVADLMIEAVFFDESTSQYSLGSIFGTLADRVGIDQEILVPDLFADTTGDSILGEGDVLYSLVDLNLYLDDVPSFSLGGSFNISNGLVTELPGMAFSTTPFVFDPDSGFTGTPFTGTAVTDAQHGVSAVPELSTWAMMIVGFGAIGTLMRRQPHIPMHMAA